MQPRPQQGRRLHVHRKDPARSADKGLDTERLGPVTQFIGAKLFQQWLQLRCALTETGNKAIKRFGMRQVETAFTCQQELAPTDGMASNKWTALPMRAKVSAAIKPAGPPPTTTTSQLRCSGTGIDSVILRRFMPSCGEGCQQNKGAAIDNTMKRSGTPIHRFLL